MAFKKQLTGCTAYYYRIKGGITRIILCIAEHTPLGNVRRKVYRLAGVKISEDARIGYGAQIFVNPNNIIIKGKAEVNHGIYIPAMDKIVIGRNTAIAPFVKLLAGANPNAPDNELKNYYSPIKKPILIGDNAGVGTGTIIFPGVAIGEMSVVATGGCHHKGCTITHCCGWGACEGDKVS